MRQQTQQKIWTYLNIFAQIDLPWLGVLTLGMVSLVMQWSLKTDHSDNKIWGGLNILLKTPVSFLSLSHLQRISCFPMQVPKGWCDGSTPLYQEPKQEVLNLAPFSKLPFFYVFHPYLIFSLGRKLHMHISMYCNLLPTEMSYKFITIFHLPGLVQSMWRCPTQYPCLVSKLESHRFDRWTTQ